MKLKMWHRECTTARKTPNIPDHWWKVIASSKGMIYLRGVCLQPAEFSFRQKDEDGEQW